MSALEQEIPTPASVADDGLDAVTRRGLAVYDARLKAQLEPAHNGEAVAIHVDSGEYAVARTSGVAMREMRRRRPDGPLVLHTIGPVSDEMAYRTLKSRSLLPTQ